MQPQQVKELHLVFKPTIPPGAQLISRATDVNRIQTPEIQRITKGLTSSLNTAQLIGTFENTTRDGLTNDVDMSNGGSTATTERTIRWSLVLQDIPEAGTQTLSSRQTYTVPIDGGDPMLFMSAFGFVYRSRYLQEGVRFFDRDATLFLSRPVRISQASSSTLEGLSTFDDDSKQLLDESGGYVLQTSVEVVDGMNKELKDRATKQLMALSDTLKQAVSLTPGDRLALDTRFKA